MRFDPNEGWAKKTGRYGMMPEFPQEQMLRCKLHADAWSKFWWHGGPPFSGPRRLKEWAIARTPFPGTETIEQEIQIIMAEKRPQGMSTQPDLNKDVAEAFFRSSSATASIEQAGPMVYGNSHRPLGQDLKGFEEKELSPVKLKDRQVQTAAQKQKLKKKLSEGQQSLF